MSYTGPTKDLDKDEIFDYLNQEKPLTEIIRQAWKDGFEWGFELGYEEAKDEYE